MRFFGLLATCVALASATIEENWQTRKDPYPGVLSPIAIYNGSGSQWKSYPPSAKELGYKGRWDSKYISWWAAPGLKFGFTGENVAISFGRYTSPGVLVAYRFAGQDWQFTNVTANATYQFISSGTPGLNLTTPANGVKTLEIRITNWSLGVQIARVWTGKNDRLIKLPDEPLTIEFIGDS